jgi:hypothetical protein
MKKLEVGTEVCAVHSSRTSNRYSYIFTRVAKVTAKRATLENGDVVNNEQIERHGGLYFESYGKCKNAFYRIVTPEILADHAQIEETTKINLWFFNKKFTAEEKAAIYKQFEQLGKL